MNYVYILRSVSQTEQIYTGFTKDLKTRVKGHNYGKNKHTKKYKPWELVAYFAFRSEEQAKSFEVYLETGSGIAFARKHLIK